MFFKKFSKKIQLRKMSKNWEFEASNATTLHWSDFGHMLMSQRVDKKREKNRG